MLANQLFIVIHQNPLLHHRIFGGLILDIKRKAPHYLSDYTDAISLQCLASFLFLYCACMSPVITFGGLLGEATEGRVVRGNIVIAPKRHWSYLEKKACLAQTQTISTIT